MLKKAYRLTKRGSFTYVYNKGERKSDRLISVVYIPGKNTKIGFSVPNKIGKAVVRNVLKRRLRAYMRELVPFIRPAQIVIALKPGSEALTYAELIRGVRELLIKANLLPKYEK